MDRFMNRTITVDVLQHEATGLMVALSPEMKGLIVHGRSDSELMERIPIAIRDLMEAEGCKVESVVPVNEDVPPGFTPSHRRFQAIAA